MCLRHEMKLVPIDRRPPSGRLPVKAGELSRVLAGVPGSKVSVRRGAQDFASIKLPGRHAKCPARKFLPVVIKPARHLFPKIRSLFDNHRTGTLDRTASMKFSQKFVVVACQASRTWISGERRLYQNSSISQVRATQQTWDPRTYFGKVAQFLENLRLRVDAGLRLWSERDLDIGKNLPRGRHGLHCQLLASRGSAQRNRESWMALLR